MSKGTQAELGKQTIRPETFAKLYDVSRSKVYQWINEGIVPAWRVGGTILIPVDGLNEYLKAHRIV